MSAPFVTVDFDAPDLAARIERLSQFDLDHQPFGVILLDGDGVIKFYSETEARQSGYRGSAIGQNFFSISRCASRGDFRERVFAALESGHVDLEFGLAGRLRRSDALVAHSCSGSARGRRLDVRRARPRAVPGR